MELTRNPQPKVMNKSRSKEASALYCASCEAHLSHTEEDEIFWADAVKCRGCGEKNTLGVLDVAASYDSAHLLGEDAYTTRWFHATDDPNWLETVTSLDEVPLIHVGTAYAAHTISDQKYIGHGYMHEIVLKSDTLLGSSVMVDTNEWHDSVTDEARSDMGGDGVRYINRCEAPGSVSLLIDPRQLVLMTSWAI